MTLAEIHTKLGNTALYYLLAISIWGFYRFFRQQGVNSSYWGALAIAELLLLAQALMGAFLWIGGSRPNRGIHILYGIVVLMMIPGSYVYTKGRSDRPEMLAYGTATIIGVGLLIRAMFTAVPLV
ncbi:MAG: hypothetical protein FVQ83_12380 [Chloroflexi bacterium]|nr:hypothetical protein [Chloroflexota bacterium]